MSIIAANGSGIADGRVIENFSPERLPNINTIAQIKNKKMNKEFSAGTGDENSTKDDGLHVSPACIKPNVIGSSGYWIICQYSYEYEGNEIPKGRMKFHTSQRPVLSKRWRRATDEEIKTKRWFKGNYFNLQFV